MVKSDNGKLRKSSKNYYRKPRRMNSSFDSHPENKLLHQSLLDACQIQDSGGCLSPISSIRNPIENMESQNEEAEEQLIESSNSDVLPLESALLQKRPSKEEEKNKCSDLLGSHAKSGTD